MSIKKREDYKIIILEPAKSRLERRECPACGLHRSKWNRRNDWRCCTEGCTAVFNDKYILYGWSDLREKALKRDNYTCVKCGNKPALMRTEYFEVGGKWEMVDFYFGESDPSQLDGDHIKAIALGGDQWDMDNIQTLCHKCHKIKTRQDIKKIAVERRLSADQRRLV